MPPLAPLLFCGTTLGDELSPEGGTRLTLDGWMQVDVSARAAAVVLEVHEQTDPNPNPNPNPNPTPTQPQPNPNPALTRRASRPARAGRRC